MAKSIVAAALLAPAARSLEGKTYIRGIYLSPSSACREWLLKKVEEAGDHGDLNAVVVDMKDDFGALRYPSENKIARSVGAVRPIFNVDTLIHRMHSHNVRVIARLVCFKDDLATGYSGFGIDRAGGGLWVDEGKAHWMNAYNESVWDYLASIAKELEDRGFDEVQLDYVRFPTDGDVGSCVFYGTKGRKKEEAIEGFLQKMRSSITVPLSVDVFGYAAWRTLRLEGQELSRIGPNVDYICPMLYPSHFSPSDFYGLPTREFWVYYESVESAYKLLDRTGAGVVAYIQGFSWRAPGYGPDYILNQMIGSLAAGADGFFIWNASGDYLPAFEALSWGGSWLRERAYRNSPDTHTKSIPHQPLCELTDSIRIHNPARSWFLPRFLDGIRNGSRHE